MSDTVMQRRIPPVSGLILLGLLLTACGAGPDRRLAPPEAAQNAIQAEDLMRHIRVLASDEFEGRAPGTKGEDLTVEYLTEQFQAVGAQPGNPDGTYVQKVPLVGITSRSDVRITAGGRPLPMEFKKDYIAVSRRATPSVSVRDSELVFVGYGVVAPEYGWDDYKDVDVKGKTIVMLVNDPAVPDANDPSKLDDSMFNGRAMTYYGRWTYKYEIATEKGAAAAIIIHETGPAGYPFEVVSGSWGRENFDIQRQDRNMGRVAVESWITEAKARELLSRTGQDFDALKKAAVQKDFRPVALNARAAIQVKNEVRNVESRNVIAKIEGTSRKDEYVVYSSHWDHLGRDTTLTGDQIFNGALDNASGVSCLLELAEAFAKLPEKPARSILFLAVTAEEKGLLGAKYYAENPLYPLRRTAANINMDGFNQWGRTSDVTVVGQGQSNLEDILEEVAKSRGRTVSPEAEPEKGSYYRSDHFEFAKQGVPALYIGDGNQFIGKPSDFAKTKRDEYVANDYHKVTDEIKPDWDLSGAVEDTRLLFEVGYRIAQQEAFPEWKEGSEFRARRLEMMK
jgi:Zn-dependent M28 family amino/carboxypeptidase